MYLSNLFGIAVCFVVLMESKCAARWPNKQGESGEYVTRTKIPSSQCEDIWDVSTCGAAKLRNRCDILMYKEQCNKTCGACAPQTSVTLPRNEVNIPECRDIGTPEFCLSVKPICERQRYGRHSRVRFALRFCKKTCGVCSIQPKIKPKKQSLCVDRPICKKLTTFYKITTCNTLPDQLKKRAMRKCPKLCGLCGGDVTEKKEPEIAEARKPIVDVIERPQTIVTNNDRKRQPQPPIQSRESDQEPRRGVFYIFTKYLSL